MILGVAELIVVTGPFGAAAIAAGGWGDWLVPHPETLMT
jgi:hypothetical protein